MHPLRHDELTDPRNLNAAEELGEHMLGFLEGEKRTTAITAATLLLMTLCEGADVEPDQVLEQIMDTALFGEAKLGGMN